jgi:hypothetical protein
MKHLELFESDNWLNADTLNENRQTFLDGGIFNMTHMGEVKSYEYANHEIDKIIKSTEEGYECLETISDMIKNGELKQIIDADVRSIDKSISQKATIFKALKELKK